jgi:hypothetical protein
MAKLLLYDPEFREHLPAMASTWKIGLKERIAIRSLAEVVKAIGQYTDLEEVIFWFHGVPGGIIIGQHGYDMSAQPLRQAFAKNKTRIWNIRFEGCWVGEAPDEMAQFGRLFDAWCVYGYTWAHWHASAVVTIPKGATVKSLEGTVMKDLQRWLAPDSPKLEQLASMAVQRDVRTKLNLEWYEYSGTSATPPPWEKAKGQQLTNFERFSTVKYKRRSEAGKRVLTDRETEEISNTNPTSPFEYVQVRIGVVENGKWRPKNVKEL